LPSEEEFKVERAGKPIMIDRHLISRTCPHRRMRDNARFATFAAPLLTVSSAMSTSSTTMTPIERRSSVSLALIFALRMLGLFLVLPVFALEATQVPRRRRPGPGGPGHGHLWPDAGVLQLPLGMASDRFGRKRVIVLGLLVFAAGSLLARWRIRSPGCSWAGRCRARAPCRPP
jgi:hypothetical protein